MSEDQARARGVKVQRAAKPPESYAVTAAYADLALCERFGWSIEYVENLPAGVRAVVDAYAWARAHQDRGGSP